MKTIFVAALKEETPELNKFHHTGVGKNKRLNKTNGVNTAS